MDTNKYIIIVIISLRGKATFRISVNDYNNKVLNRFEPFSYLWSSGVLFSNSRKASQERPTVDRTRNREDDVVTQTRSLPLSRRRSYLASRLRNRLASCDPVPFPERSCLAKRLRGCQLPTDAQEAKTTHGDFLRERRAAVRGEDRGSMP
ncbi:hypothetical protein F2P81_010813 [Scophthalmus maximus]|uniref:Uncharacterized protein n=1 Tax=Scophthalmus maximus TaxID=52904 RepID=A0A6A4SYY4_SCOMX|nr:hypothetical protein F2P81_010813 [Scophthalmus maximus]